MFAAAAKTSSSDKKTLLAAYAAAFFSIVVTSSDVRGRERLSTGIAKGAKVASNVLSMSSMARTLVSDDCVVTRFQRRASRICHQTMISESKPSEATANERIGTMSRENSGSVMGVLLLSKGVPHDGISLPGVSVDAGSMSAT